MNATFDTHEFVHVYTTYGLLAGEMIRVMLDTMGIPAFVSQESAGTAMGFTIGSLGEARIYVRASQVDEAKQALRDMEEGRLDAPMPYFKRLDEEPLKNNKMAAGEVFKPPPY